MQRPAQLAPPDVRDLAPLSRSVVAYNVVYLGAVWAVVFGAMALFHLWPSWATFVIAYVLVSSRQQALLNIEHECIHGTLVRGRQWNERVGAALCASPCASPYYASRARHLAHHRLLATADDPDAVLHTGDDKSTVGGLVRHFVLGLLGGYALIVLFSRSGVNVDQRLHRRDRRNVVIGQIVLAGIIWVLFDWWLYPLLWLAPLATVTAALHLVRSFCEHAVAPDEQATHADRLITLRSNPIERFLVAPYNMNYHAEHHLFPWVPAPRLPELRRRLESGPDPSPWLARQSYAGALLRFAREAG